MSIFQAYDIRGKYPEELNEFNVYNIVRAFAKLLKCKTIAVARDARLSSEALHEAIVSGLLDSGINVTDIGLTTTPMLYFASFYYKFDGAIMITASHLGKEYNGLKLCKKNAVDLSYSDLKQIEKLSKQKFKPVKRGKLVTKEIFNDYKKYILKNSKKTNLKVVVDTANMMSYLDVQVLKEISNVIPLFLEVDGNFPNHGVNPLIESNLKIIKKEIQKQKADLGIAFDGDADRVIFLDENSKVISPDIITALLTENIPRNSKVIFDVRSSKYLQESLDIKPILSKAGRSLIQESMIKNKAQLGGEKSGHYYFKEFNYGDNALLTTIKVLKILNREKKKFSELVNKFKIGYSQGELNFKVKNKDKALQIIKKEFTKDSIKVLNLDGISIYHKDYWFNLRKSNTEDLVRLNLEAKTKEIFTEIMKKLSNLLNNLI